MSTSPRSTPPTIDDVAEAAGVSRSTVSRALGGYGQVSPDARKKILAAAEELDYRVNLVARSTRTGRTDALGLVVADVGERFFAAVARGFSDVARDAGYQVIMANTDDDAEEERRALTVLQQGRVDGLAVAPAQYRTTASLLDSKSARVPMVTIDRRTADRSLDSVLLNSSGAAREAVSRLIGAGHRNIAIITGQTAQLGSWQIPGTVSPGTERIRGYVEALRGAGVEIDSRNVLQTTRNLEGASNDIVALLSRPDRPTALFVTDEWHALCTLMGVRLAQLRIPDDLSVVSIDDPEWAAVITPPLSVVAQPSYEVGALAARRLLSRVAGEDLEPEEFVMDYEWIPRESVAAPPRR